MTDLDNLEEILTEKPEYYEKQYRYVSNNCEKLENERVEDLARHLLENIKNDRETAESKLTLDMLVSIVAYVNNDSGEFIV